MTDDQDPIDFTPLYGKPDPARLDRLAERITASLAARRRPRSVMAQLAAWAPAAIGCALLAAALAWIPALASPPRHQPDSSAAMLLELALSDTGPRGERLILFSP